jgi:hypothetical protein
MWMIELVPRVVFGPYTHAPVALAALLPAVLPSPAQCQAQVSHCRVGLLQQASVQLEVAPQVGVAPVTDRHAGSPGPLDEPVRVVDQQLVPGGLDVHWRQPGQLGVQG